MKEMMEKMAMMDGDSKKDSDLQAKMEVLKELHEMATSLLGNDLEGMDDMEQVTVAADDREGLEEGLDKAKELLEDSDKTGDFY